MSYRYTVKNVINHPTFTELLLTPGEDGQMFFVPGQYATISFKTGGRYSPVRCFSMTNDTKSAELSFAMRRHGRFTKQISELLPGTSVKVQGSFGQFVIDPDFDKQIIMLAAGIGITPYMSMLRQAAKSKITSPIVLLYRSKSADNIPFYDEIMKLRKQIPDFRVFFLVGDGKHNPSARIYSRKLNIEVIESVIKGSFSDYSYFICGPNNFNETFDKKLKQVGVSEDQIVTESFIKVTKSNWLGFNMSLPAITYITTSLALVAGFFFIMTIDLARYLPKVHALELNTNSNNSTNNTSTATGSNTSSSANSSSTGSNTTATNSGNNTSSSSSSNNQSYSAPVSSVS